MARANNPAPKDAREANQQVAASAQAALDALDKLHPGVAEAGKALSEQRAREAGE